MSNIVLPNRLGWVTRADFNVTNDLIDVSSFGEYGKVIHGASAFELNLTIRAVPTPALYQLVTVWMDEGVYSPTFQREFKCLWCGSPNSIELTHCKKCGGARSFIVG